MITSFKLTKEVTYDTSDEALWKSKRLEHLKEHGLGDIIHVPRFEYKLDGNQLTYESDYIKGDQLNEKYMPIIKRELLERESDWTAIDYSHQNYIISKNKIYLVDLSCYGHYPDRNFRIYKWNEKMNNRKWTRQLI